MGYAFMIGPCFCCKRGFTFNPLRVPSYRINGVREPVCQNCIALANIKREENGLDPITYSVDAYEPIKEEELP